MSNMTNLITFSDQEKAIIAKLVKQSAPKANQNDVNYFIYYCELYGLNPITGDAVLQKYGQNPQILTTRDGWIKAASQMPGFVGPPISHPIYKGDTVEMLNGGTDIKHIRDTNSEEIVGAYAIMHHEKYHSITQTVDMRDYFNANSGLANNKRKNVWDSYPSAMIVKIAEVFALRRMFPLGQVSTREEMSIEGDQTPQADTSDIVGNTEANTHKSKPAKKQTTSSKQGTSAKKQEEQPKEDKSSNEQEAAQPKQESQEEDKPSFISEENVMVLDKLLQQLVDITGKDRELLLNSVDIPDDLASVEDKHFKTAKTSLEGLLKKAQDKFGQKEDESEQQNESSQENAPEQNAQVQDAPEQEESTPKQEEPSDDQNGIVLPDQHETLQFTVGEVMDMESKQGKPFKQIVPQNDIAKVFNVGGSQEIAKGNTVKGKFRQDERQGETFLFLTNVEVVA